MDTTHRSEDGECEETHPSYLNENMSLLERDVYTQDTYFDDSFGDLAKEVAEVVIRAWNEL